MNILKYKSAPGIMRLISNCRHFIVDINFYLPWHDTYKQGIENNFKDRIQILFYSDSINDDQETSCKEDIITVNGVNYYKRDDFNYIYLSNIMNMFNDIEKTIEKKNFLENYVCEMKLKGSPEKEKEL